MTTPHDLEAQLRDHYAEKASELSLPDLGLDDVLARGEVPVMAAAASPRRGWIAGAVAAALVGGAVVGAGVVLVTDDDPGLSSRPTVLPQTEPPAPGGAPGFCETAEMPADVAELELQNDIRVANLLLPARTPDGYCSGDHNVTSLNGLSGGEYTVWTDCGACEQPTAAIARVFTGVNLEVNETGAFESVQVDGSEGRYYGPDEANPLGRLYVGTGPEDPLTLIGWGLDEAGFALFAAELTADDVDLDRVAGMQLVYNRTLDSYSPGLIPFASTLDVWYYRDDGSTALRYSVLDYQDQPPLEAYAWVMPDPSFSTVGGAQQVAFPAAPSYGGLESTAVIMQVDENTQVLWASTGESPTPPEELAAIELSPAAVDDPRWLEIAYESGQYEGVG